MAKILRGYYLAPKSFKFEFILEKKPYKFWFIKKRLEIACTKGAFLV